MGIAKTSLEYINSSGNWQKAVTAGGADAVIMLVVEQSINSASKAEILVSNRSPNSTSSTPSSARGPLTNTFTDFQRIRLVHQAIGIPIFSGRIYRIRDMYDMQYGQTIKLTAFDSFKEMLEFPIEGVSDNLKSIDTTDSDEGGYDLRKRSQLIKYTLNEVGLKDKNILTTDADHFEDSWDTGSLGDTKLNLTKLDRNVGGVINELAIGDTIKNQSGTALGDSGYDFRIEPRFLSSAVNHTPNNDVHVESLHYFMRGTRPGKGGAYGGSATPVLTTTTTDSLTIESSSADSPADSGLKQTMMSMYEFDKPKGELLTSVVCHYTDMGKEDASNAEESTVQREGVVTFELLKGSALSGTFTWADKALDVTRPGVVNVPELLNISGGATGVARVQWQNSSTYLLLISDINEATFPTSGSVTLVGASSWATFTFNAATGRMKTKYGVERPVRIQRSLTSNLGMIRDEVVGKLVGRMDLEIIRGKFQTIQYPIVYYDLPSNVSRSVNTISWTGTVAAQTRGIRKGNIVAEIDTTGYVRYAYISAVNSNTSITYGSSATDTSDGTAINPGNTIRLIVPLRAGDVIKVINPISDVNTDQIILSLKYNESPGVFDAQYETIGSNGKFSNIYEEGDALRAAIAATKDKKFPEAKPIGETSFFFDGFINRGVNPSGTNDYRQIHWTNAAGNTLGTSGTLTTGDGTKFTIACANSSVLTTAEHTIFFRPVSSKATAYKSDTTFQVVLTTSYNKDSDDILVGWCHASDNKAGAKAVLILQPQFMSKDLFAAGQNGTLTEALLSKSAQEYSSGLEITPVTSGFDNPTNTRHQQVTWAACTATSGSTESPDERLTFGDGDVWNIAAKSGSNYSVTSNGTSYANITALAVSSTYYAFVDTAETAAGGTLNLRFTTSYSHISTASDGTFFSSRILMAQIAVPANGDDGAAPRIFPFNNRSLVLNAAAIGADSITATHITGTTITTIRQGTTKADVGLGSVDNNSTNTIRGGVTPIHVSDNMSGVTMDTNGNIYSGSKSSYGSNTAGWFIGFDSGTPKINIGSGSNSLKWTGSALEILGDISGSTGTFVGDISGASGTFAGTVSAAGGQILLNTTGIHLIENDLNNYINFENSSGTSQSALRATTGYTLWTTKATGGSNHAATGTGLVFGNDCDGSHTDPSLRDMPITQSLTFRANYIGIHPNGRNNSEGPIYYAFSNSVPTDGQVLARNGNTSTQTINGTSRTVYPLDWVDAGGSGDITAVVAGSGMTGGATSGSATITMGTPGTLTSSTSNAVTSTSHTHAVTGLGGSDPSLLGNGSNTAPSYSFSADTDTGMYRNTVSASTLAFAHDATTRIHVFSEMEFNGALDMNNYSIYDAYEVRCRAGGAYDNPSFSWDSAQTSGIYHSSGVYITVGSSTKFGAASSLNYNYQKVYVSDYPDLASGGFYVKSDGTGILQEATSTRRAKMDIQDIVFDTSKVYNLNPVSFRYRAQQVDANGASLKDDNGLKLYTDVPAEGEDSPLQFGMIAEEVYEHIPELVALNTTANQPIGIDYPLLSVLLLAELKKLKSRIEILEGN